jgi:hypothetical protein
MAQALALGARFSLEWVGVPCGEILFPLQAIFCCSVLLVLLVLLPRGGFPILRGGSAVAEIVFRCSVFLVLLVLLHADEVAAAFCLAAAAVPVLTSQEDGLEGVRGRDKRLGGLVPFHVLLLLLLGLGGCCGRCCCCPLWDMGRSRRSGTG